MQTSKIAQLFEKMLPAFVKIVKPNIQKFNGNPLEYSKPAFNVEVDKKEVYDTVEKLRFCGGKCNIMSSEIHARFR